MTDWNFPGARWWKFDFHTHTPASSDTEAWQRAKNTADEMTPEKWLLKYMAAEIDCVAITDHNTGEWIDSLKQAYVALEASNAPGFRPIHIFPGVEISVHGGFHLLAIFDPSVNGAAIAALLGQAGFNPSKFGQCDEVTERAAKDVVATIISAGGVAIPAHADQDKGLLQLKENSSSQPRIDSLSLQQVLDHKGILAMEVVNPSFTPPAVYRDKGVNWARVIGSDCHTFRGPATPGSRYTWVKMATPSLQGLKLALLDGQGISIKRSDDPDVFDPYQLPEHFIESLEVKDAKHMGRGGLPCILRFNPSLNAVVGGRGTGKSTTVHALRLCYDRASELEGVDEASETYRKFIRVAATRQDSGGLLENSMMRVVVYRDGVRHRLTWTRGECTVEDSDENGNWSMSTSQQLHRHRFPVRLFSQGQIAALAGESQQALMSVIDEAANTEEVKQRVDQARQAFYATQAKRRELRTRLLALEPLKIQLADVLRKLDRFEKSHHKQLRSAYRAANAEIEAVDQQVSSAESSIENLKRIADDFNLQEFPDEIFVFPASEDSPGHQLSILRKSFLDVKELIKKQAANLENELAKIKITLDGSEWKKETTSTLEAYAAFRSVLAEQGETDPNAYERLVAERKRLERELKSLADLEAEKSRLADSAKTLLENVWSERRAVSAKRQSFLDEVLRDNPFVRITLIPYSRDAHQIERALRGLLNVGEKFKEDIYSENEDGIASGLVGDLFAFEALVGGDTPMTAEFEDAIKALQVKLIAGCKDQSDLGGRFTKFLVAELSRRADIVDQISCWIPEDGLQVEYSRKGNGRDFQSIGQASAGQRSAAMLAFLLAHGTEPLILDQPEDDLDNYLVYDLVVKQIRQNKQRRQLIVITHNPNIVVNGDAEMIYALNFNNQCRVSKEGSLQDESMREVICEIMEGGTAAFERRYQRLARHA